MKVLCISVHPDDETLGCGGTLLRHRAESDDIYWLIATKTYEPQWSKEVIERKAQEVSRVAHAYGMKDVFRLGLPTIKLDNIDLSEIIDGIRDAVAKVRPEIVYMVHDGDVHTDHHAVYTAAMSVLKTFYMKQMGVERILSYETLSSTEAAPQQFHRLFVPNVYRDITSFVDKKIEIMSFYESETQEDPMPRGPSAIRALARYRGASIGVEYAEVFMMVREVI